MRCAPFFGVLTCKRSVFRNFEFFMFAISCFWIIAGFAFPLGWDSSNALSRSWDLGYFMFCQSGHSVSVAENFQEALICRRSQH
jgi:hypothetical protein